MRKLLVALLALAACAGDSNDDTIGPNPNPGSDGGGGGGGGGGGTTDEILQDFDGVAAAIGTNIKVAEIGAMVDAIGLAYGRIPAGFTEMSTTGEARIASGTRDGLSITYKFYCRDDADAFDTCDGMENHEHIKVTITGEMFQRTVNWIVRDVRTPTPFIGGEDGTATFSTTVATGTFDISFTDTSAHVKFDAANPTLPLAGTIDLMLTVHRNRNGRTRDFSTTASIVFAGDDSATISFDGGAHVYALTVSTGAVVRKN